MAGQKNKWTQPNSPPPPLFVGQAERNFVKQINDEIVEKIVGQQIVYYPIDLERSNFHPLYGESLSKTYDIRRKPRTPQQNGLKHNS